MVALAAVEDIAYLARGFAGVAEHLKRFSDSPFVGELATGTAMSRSVAESFVGDPNKFAFVASNEDGKVRLRGSADRFRKRRLVRAQGRTHRLLLGRAARPKTVIGSPAHAHGRS